MLLPLGKTKLNEHGTRNTAKTINKTNFFLSCQAAHALSIPIGNWTQENAELFSQK